MSLSASSSTILLTATLGLGACQLTAPVGEGPDPQVQELSAPAPVQDDPTGPSPPPLEDDTRAIEAIRSGDYALAHEILGRILFAEHLAEARAYLAEDRPDEALLQTEQALRLLPHDPEARLVDARARLRLAERAGGPGHAPPQEALVDALSAYASAGESAEALFGASRAAFLLERHGVALDYARRGMEVLGSGDGVELNLGRLPQRIYAEAAYAAYAELIGREDAKPGERDGLFQTTLIALSSLLGRAASDPWVHTTLSRLYEQEARDVDALEALLRGLDYLPDNRAMLDRAVEVAHRMGGAEAALDTVRGFRERHPTVAGGAWHEGRETFQLALTAFGEGRPDLERFRAAETSFALARELDADYDASSRDYEVLCRAAIGWCLLEDDAKAAVDSFKSMDELVQGGIHREIEGRLRSGVAGLEACSGRLNETQRWIDAADASEYLRQVVPQELRYASEAGYFLRSAALEFASDADRLCRAVRGEIQDPETLTQLRALANVSDGEAPGSEEERATLLRVSEKRADRARRLMERAAAAYRSAATLAPDNIRIVNDAAQVYLDYLHTDLDQVETMLLRCVELGRVQLHDDQSLEHHARLELENAWGDAHQNLGVLYFNFHDDPEKAEKWFAEAALIGDPRPDIEGYWLPKLRGQLPPEQAEDDLHAPGVWPRPCD